MNNIRMQCRLCGEVFYFSEKDIKKCYPIHCGKIGLVFDYSDFNISQNRWIAYTPHLSVKAP